MVSLPVMATSFSTCSGALEVFRLVVIKVGVVVDPIRHHSDAVQRMLVIGHFFARAAIPRCSRGSFRHYIPFFLLFFFGFGFHIMVR